MRCRRGRPADDALADAAEAFELVVASCLKFQTSYRRIGPLLRFVFAFIEIPGMIRARPAARTRAQGSEMIQRYRDAQGRLREPLARYRGAARRRGALACALARLQVCAWAGPRGRRVPAPPHGPPRVLAGVPVA